MADWELIGTRVVTVLLFALGTAIGVLIAANIILLLWQELMEML